jgi:hypothetical protein
MNQTNRKYFNMAGKVCILLVGTILVAACGGSGGGDEDVQGVADRGQGPRFSVDVSAHCGNPYDVVYDIDLNPIHTFTDEGYEAGNVVIFLSNESDDSGPIKENVAMLEIQCYEKVGKGKDGYEKFGDKIEIAPADFGKLVRNCPSESGTEIKATVTVIDADLHKGTVSDNCEEVVLY